MNERIRELYRQAHGTRHYDGDPARDGNPPTVYWQGEVSAERFANLLIQECIQVCLSRRDPPNLNYKPSVAFADELRLHFGVK
jgi:hypothetical protein